MNIRKIFSPLIAIVIALLIYQSYNIYAENELIEGIAEEVPGASNGEEGGLLLPAMEGTVPLTGSTEGTVPLPAEGTQPVPPAEEPPLPPVEATASVPSEEETLPLPAVEATVPAAPVEETVPMPAEATTPLPPVEGTVPVPVSIAPLPPPIAAPLPLPGAEETKPTPPMKEAAPLPAAEATAPLPPAEGTVPVPVVSVPPPIEIPVSVYPPKEEIFWVSSPPERKKEYVGTEKCRSCHVTQYGKWNKTIHARWQPSFTSPEKAEKARIGCETCHGPGSLHIENNQERLFITTFGPQSKDTREEQNAVCLTCHNKGGLYYWNGGIHSRAQRCVDCHQVMERTSEKNLLNRSSEKEVCLRCHLQKKAQTLRSPHLSRDDAKMTCSTCHAPHGSDTPGLLSASSVNENCYRCHADKRGPYLFDHFPVQENCLLCHDPHASANKALLKVRQPFLCLECHSNLPNALPLNADPHRVLDSGGRYTYNKGCINCHPMIHGSRHPSGARLQR